MSASVEMSADKMSNEELALQVKALKLQLQVAELEKRVSEAEYAKSKPHKGGKSHKGRNPRRGGNSHMGGNPRRGGNSRKGPRPCRDGDRCQKQDCAFAHDIWNYDELRDNVHNFLLKKLRTVENDTTEAEETGIYDGIWSFIRFGSWLAKSPNARALKRNIKFFKTKLDKKLTELLDELLTNSDTIILILIESGDNSKPQWALCLDDEKESAADSDAGTDAGTDAADADSVVNED